MEIDPRASFRLKAAEKGIEDNGILDMKKDW